MKKYIPNLFPGIIFAAFYFMGIIAPAFAADEIATIVTPESILWSAAQKTKKKEGYENYLAQYPEGKFTNLAREAIKKLITDEAVREENTQWKVLQDSEDGNAIQRFIDKYPKGGNAMIAKKRLTAIRKIETGFKPGQSFKGCPTCPEMVIVPAGTFLMGGVNNSHRVTFAQPFAIGKKEVTQKEWIAVMGRNPSKFMNCIGNCPVDNVSWNDVNEFIRRLNVKTGKVYRLPSEAEWEYACRAGMRQEYCGSDDANSVAWYGTYSTAKLKFSRSSKAIATKKANAWGLYDMSGNIAEWTADGYHANFTGAPVDGSAWQGDGRGYVLRGGSWEGRSEQVSATYRDYDGPSNRDVTYGFRIARKFP